MKRGGDGGLRRLAVLPISRSALVLNFERRRLGLYPRTAAGTHEESELDQFTGCECEEV